MIMVISSDEPRQRGGALRPNSQSPATEISPTVPSFYHHDKNRRRNQQNRKCQSLPVLLIMKSSCVSAEALSGARAVAEQRRYDALMMRRACHLLATAPQ
jgi:hypothetical protein